MAAHPRRRSAQRLPGLPVFGKAMLTRAKADLSSTFLRRLPTLAIQGVHLFGAKGGVNRSLSSWRANSRRPGAVNAIQPGFFPAEQNQAAHRRTRGIHHEPHAMRRYGAPSELIAAPCIWLPTSILVCYRSIVRVDGGFGA